MVKDYYYLEYHDDAKNSHKYYIGLETDSDIGLLAWGRIGGRGQSKEASRKLVVQMMRDKLKKGYVDKTDEMPQYLKDLYFPKMSKILEEWNEGKEQSKMREYACGFGDTYNHMEAPIDENGEYEFETLCVKWDEHGNVLDIIIVADPSGKTRKPTVDDYRYIVKSGQFDNSYVDYKGNYEEVNRGHWIDNLMAYIQNRAKPRLMNRYGLLNWWNFQ